MILTTMHIPTNLLTRRILKSGTKRAFPPKRAAALPRLPGILACLLAVASAFVPARAAALEITLSGGAGNTGFKDDGTMPADLGMMFLLGIKSDINEKVAADIQIQQNPVFGRTISAEGSYDAGFIKFVAGPVFGFLNEGDSQWDASLLQPGLRLGFSLFFLDKLTLEASTDFCILTADNDSSLMYPSRARLALGAVFPALICTAAINQKTAFTSGDGGYRQVLTDYGVYTQIFAKASPVQFDVDFIFRTIAFQANDAEASNLADTSAASLVLGGGVSLRSGSKTFFVNGHGALYTFTLDGEDVENPAMYDISAGVRISTD